MNTRKPNVKIEDWGQFLTSEDQVAFRKLNAEIAHIEKHLHDKLLARRKLRTKAQHAARSVALHKLAAELKAPTVAEEVQADLFDDQGSVADNALEHAE